MQASAAAVLGYLPAFSEVPRSGGITAERYMRLATAFFLAVTLLTLMATADVSHHTMMDSLSEKRGEVITQQVCVQDQISYHIPVNKCMNVSEEAGE